MSLSMRVCSIAIVTQLALAELLCKNEGGCCGLDDMARRRGRKWKRRGETTQ